MKKKIIALSIAFILIVGAAIGTTLAYLTDKGGVINNFAVGDVDFTANEYVNHTNAQNVDKDPEGTTDEETETPYAGYKKIELSTTPTNYNYSNVLPGDKLAKDVVIKPTATSSDAYYAVYVTVKNGVAVEKINGALKGDAWTATAAPNLGIAKDYTTADNKPDEATLIAVEKGTIAAAGEGENTDTGYIFYYFVPAGKSDSIPVDLDVECPTEVNKDSIDAFSGMKIAVNVAAIQAEGFTSAQDAIEELESTYAADKLALNFASDNGGENA